MMEFTRLTEEHIADLKRLIEPDRVFWRDEINPDYSHDELSLEHHFPEAVVEPLNTKEVQDVLAYCYAKGLPVTPRGSGTGLCGGAVALYGGVLLVTSRMNRIIEIDSRNMMARVEPGVLLMDFQQAVEEQGLFYAPDPGEKTATLGGNVSTNAGGMRAIKYGVTRDHVLGLEAVISDGSVIHTGGKVVKNSSGYSLLDLLIGSEGTLAVITEITLKLLPKPEQQISLLVPFHDLRKAVEAVPQILSQGTIPAALEFFQQEVMHAAEKYLGRHFPHSSAPAYLLLTFLGNDEQEMERAYEKVAQTCLDCGAIDVLIANTLDRQEGIWECRGAFLEALKGMGDLDEVDVVVPPSEIAEFISSVEELREEYALPILSFGHAGDGNLHIYFLRGDLARDKWLDRSQEVMEIVYEDAQKLTGQVSGEHGIGYAKRDFLAQSLGPAQMRLLQGIKATFDPKGLLNPGKVVS